MPDAYRMTQAQYAEHRQISQPRIATLIKVGKLEGAYKKKGRRYFIDPDRADRLLDQNLNPIYRPGGPDPGGPDPAEPFAKKAGNGRTMSEAARLHMWYRAALAKLKYERESGALVSKEDVAKQANHFGQLVRTHLESLPAKLAPELAGMRSPKKIAETLQQEIRQVLITLSHDIKKL